MELINHHIKELKKTCEHHRVKSLYAFGSIASGEMNDQSDVDLLVEFGIIDPEDYFENYLSFKKNLEEIFSKKVDLVEKQTLKNPVLIKAINRGKKLIYERKGTEVAV